MNTQTFARSHSIVVREEAMEMLRLGHTRGAVATELRVTWTTVHMWHCEFQLAGAEIDAYLCCCDDEDIDTYAGRETIEQAIARYPQTH